MKPKGFIVVFDDESCLCLPYGDDKECEGALCHFGNGESVRLFKSRSEARKAIKISRAFALLKKSQGKPENSDFTDGIKNIKIVPCN